MYNEEVNRTLKAIRIARSLRVAAAPVEDVEKAGEDFWQVAADYSGENMPSERTRAIVIAILREELV